MIKSNKKGFSLIELMVVVGIIATLSMIAIPNFQRFAAKAKQANAKTELASIYGFEQAFVTEFNTYHSNLVLIGYTPDGATLGNAAAGADSGCPMNFPTRIYATGFKAAATVPFTQVVPGIPVVPCSGATTITSYFYPDWANGAAAGVATALTGGEGEVTQTAFLAASHGLIRAGASEDRWTMDQTKALNNSQVGF